MFRVSEPSLDEAIMMTVLFLFVYIIMLLK